MALKILLTILFFFQQMLHFLYKARHKNEHASKNVFYGTWYEQALKAQSGNLFVAVIRQ